MKHLLIIQKIVILTVLAGFASNSFAEGTDHSGGGNAIVCFKSRKGFEKAFTIINQNKNTELRVNPFADPEILVEVESVESFDLYQAQLPMGVDSSKEIPLLAPGDKSSKYVQKIFNRLNRVSSAAAEFSSTWANLGTQKWIAAAGLESINDVQKITIPSRNCLRAQVANQVQNRIYFDKFLLPKMNGLNLAGLMVHEYLYYIARQNGVRNSDEIQDLVGQFFLNDQDWENLTYSLKDIMSLTLRINQILKANYHTRFSTDKGNGIALIREGWIEEIPGFEGFKFKLSEHCKLNGDLVENYVPGVLINLDSFYEYIRKPITQISCPFSYKGSPLVDFISLVRQERTYRVMAYAENNVNLKNTHSLRLAYSTDAVEMNIDENGLTFSDLQQKYLLIILTQKGIFYDSIGTNYLRCQKMQVDFEGYLKWCEIAETYRVGIWKYVKPGDRIIFNKNGDAKFP